MNKNADNSYQGACHSFLSGKKTLTLITKRYGAGEGETQTHTLKVSFSGEKEGLGIFEAEYVHFKMSGEYGGNILNCKLSNDHGGAISFIGEATKYGIAGWMWPFGEEISKDPWRTTQAAIFNKT